MTMRSHRILKLMRETGAPLIISGIDVRKWRWVEPTRSTRQRVVCGVTPLITERPGAYRATVGGSRVSIKAALHLLAARTVDFRRGWHVRVRCWLPRADGESVPVKEGS